MTAYKTQQLNSPPKSRDGTEMRYGEITVSNEDGKAKTPIVNRSYN